MAGKSDYLEAAILNHIFRTTALTQPGTLYVALFTAAPSDAGGGTEVAGGSYARASVGSADADWSAPSGDPRQVGNAGAITFPTATGTWGTLTHFAIMDAASAGNQLYWGALTSTPTISSGMTPSFAAGALTVSED